MDSHLCFLHMGVLGGGRNSDYKVYQRSKVKTCIENFLTPFCGNTLSIPENDAYNFYLSQLHICVEMAFGLHNTKRWILCTPLEVELAESGNVQIACCILHNYCINQ